MTLTVLRYRNLNRSTNQKKGPIMAKQILVIDDDPVVVKYLTTLFSDNGYETDTASNGVEGLEKLKANKPDLVTLDLEMPEEWGSRLYRKMAKDESIERYTGHCHQRHGRTPCRQIRGGVHCQTV